MITKSGFLTLCEAKPTFAIHDTHKGPVRTCNVTVQPVESAGKVTDILLPGFYPMGGTVT